MKEAYIRLMLTHLYLVWAIEDNSSPMSSNLTWLADMLQKLYPGANICTENRTWETTVKTFPSGYDSCCVDCSCGPNCEADGNCCFPDTNPTQGQFSDTLHPEPTCLFPSTVQPSEDVRYIYQYYKMISTVPVRFEDQTLSLTNVSCGEEKVAPWGSLYPVYSAKRKSIYKNLACAEADDVEDGILWNARLHCTHKINEEFVDVTSFVFGLDSDFINERCEVDFIYPGDNEDLRPLICYVDLLDTCKIDDFTVPDVLHISRGDIKKACTSGLVSPYRHTEMFANAFCLICNAETFLSNSRCKVPKDKKRNLSLSGFISLIDYSFISETRKKYLGNHENFKACTVPAARDPLMRKCRRIFCPSGQLRDSKGQCRYPNNLWYGQDFILPIDLTLKEGIDVHQVFQVQPGKYARILPDITYPWQTNWVISYIFYENLGGNGNITKFLVILKNKIQEVRPDHLLNNIKKRISRNWTLRHNNVTSVLKSRISRYKYLSQGKESELIIGNHSETIHQPLFKMIYKQQAERPGNEFVITKLFWCEQVELTEPEFILAFDKRVLFNKLTKRLMYSGEFVLITVNLTDVVTARICVEDSGMQRSDRIAFSHGNLPSLFYSVCFSVFMLLIF